LANIEAFTVVNMLQVNANTTNVTQSYKEFKLS